MEPDRHVYRHLPVWSLVKSGPTCNLPHSLLLTGPRAPGPCLPFLSLCSQHCLSTAHTLQPRMGGRMIVPKSLPLKKKAWPHHRVSPVVLIRFPSVRQFGNVQAGVAFISGFLQPRGSARLCMLWDILDVFKFLNSSQNKSVK